MWIRHLVVCDRIIESYCLQIVWISFKVRSLKINKNKKLVILRTKAEFNIECMFGMDEIYQFILLFSLFLLLFMNHTALFDIIYRSYCTISTNSYIYLRYFQ